MYTRQVQYCNKNNEKGIWNMPYCWRCEVYSCCHVLKLYTYIYLARKSFICWGSLSKVEFAATVGVEGRFNLMTFAYIYSVYRGLTLFEILPSGTGNFYNYRSVLEYKFFRFYSEKLLCRFLFLYSYFQSLIVRVYFGNF